MTTYPEPSMLRYDTYPIQAVTPDRTGVHYTDNDHALGIWFSDHPPIWCPSTWQPVPCNL